MPNFISPDGNLEEIFISDYDMIDQFVTTGTLWTWGRNTDGQLGDNSITSKSSPVQTVSGGTNWVSISAGISSGYAIKSDGSAWVWGNNGQSQLADNTNTSRSSPVQIVGNATNWFTLSGGRQGAAGIKSDGTLWMWGINTNGQLGTNNVTRYSSPVQTVSGGNNWEVIAMGASSCGIKTDGTLWTWGANTQGNLGDNTVDRKSSPVQTVAGGTNWVRCSVGPGSAVTMSAIKSDGTLWLWGYNYFGTLGDGTSGTSSYKSSPIQTSSGGTNWKYVLSGFNNVYAIKTDGTLWGWGDNTYGQIGTNDRTARLTPVQTISGGTNWKYVSAGYHHVAAIKTDGTLWTWGRNNYGELGTNNVTFYSSPVQTVAGGNNWKYVASKGNATYAIYFYDANNLYPR